jgi:hypothetical protein
MMNRAFDFARSRHQGWQHTQNFGDLFPVSQMGTPTIPRLGSLL